MEYGQCDSSKKWTEKSCSVAPTLLGAAAGIFLGDLMSRNARRPVAASLLCLGVAALAPSVAGAVKNKVAGPNTRLGNKRTLDKIRGAGAIAGEEAEEYEELGI